jgi:flagellar biogenesis protein FliO
MKIKYNRTLMEIIVSLIIIQSLIMLLIYLVKQPTQSEIALSTYLTIIGVIIVFSIPINIFIPIEKLFYQIDLKFRIVYFIGLLIIFIGNGMYNVTRLTNDKYIPDQTYKILNKKMIISNGNTSYHHILRLNNGMEVFVPTRYPLLEENCTISGYYDILSHKFEQPVIICTGE